MKKKIMPEMTCHFPKTILNVYEENDMAFGSDIENSIRKITFHFYWRNNHHPHVNNFNYGEVAIIQNKINFLVSVGSSFKI